MKKGGHEKGGSSIILTLYFSNQFNEKVSFPWICVAAFSCGSLHDYRHLHIRFWAV